MRRIQGGKRSFSGGLEHCETPLSPSLVEYTFDHKETTMAEKLPQNLANHVRFQPPFHFFVLPVTATAWILTVINVVRHYDLLEAWALVALASAAVVAAPLIR